MQFAFATMLVGFFTQLEFLVFLANGIFSLTVHQRVSRQFYLVNLKETYENVKTVKNVLNYDQYNWEVIGDFKMIAFLMGMQGVSRNIPAIFVFGIADIPKPTIKSKYGQNVRNLLLERKMSKIFH